MQTATNSPLFLSLLLPLAGLLLLLAFAFWIWMIVDCLLHETDKDESRFKWTLAIAIANVLGAGIYFFKRKLPRKKLTLGRS